MLERVKRSHRSTRRSLAQPTQTRDSLTHMDRDRRLLFSKSATSESESMRFIQWAVLLEDHRRAMKRVLLSSVVNNCCKKKESEKIASKTINNGMFMNDFSLFVGSPYQPE